MIIVSRQVCVSAHMPPHMLARTHVNTVFSFPFFGQIHHTNEDIILKGKLHGHKLQNIFKIPKCLHCRPEHRARWPVAHYSRSLWAINNVSHPLARFPLDSLDFYGIHWNETRITLESHIKRNIKEPKASTSMRRKTLNISCCAWTPCVWTPLPGINLYIHVGTDWEEMTWERAG